MWISLRRKSHLSDCQWNSQIGDYSTIGPYVPILRIFPYAYKISVSVSVGIDQVAYKKTIDGRAAIEMATQSPQRKSDTLEVGLMLGSYQSTWGQFPVRRNTRNHSELFGERALFRLINRFSVDKHLLVALMLLFPVA